MESKASDVVVATDDPRIAEAAHKFDADVCMTSITHQSGSERIAEVCRLRGWPDNRIIVNLQGDEPTMPATLINQCAALLFDSEVDIGTLASPLANDEDLHNPNVVKVLLDGYDNALIFTRSAVPFARSPEVQSLASRTALHHHGIYAYRVAALIRMVAAPAPAIEACEQLEQLRALHLGMTIRIARPDIRPGVGVDTEADLKRAERQMKNLSV